MNNSFLGGLLLGFVIVFGIFLVVSIFTRKGNKTHYVMMKDRKLSEVKVIKLVLSQFQF